MELYIMKKHTFIKVLLAISLIILVSIAVATATITDTKNAGTQNTAITADGQVQAVSNGKIAFVSERDGNEEIYVMNADGSNVQRLTFDPVGSPKSDVNPAWSPDGTRIAFVSNRNGNYEIYVMNADGSNQQRLTSSSHSDLNPTWSPDGTRIAFATNRDTNGLYYGYEIYVMNTDGSNQQRLTYNSVDDVNPAWSPDGTRIAFATQRDGNYEIYVMNADGSNQQRMTSNTAVDGNPAWSHNGTRIVFVRNIGLYYSEIYIINANVCQECTGTPPIDLSNSPSADFDPTFSPIGTKIAFVTNRDGNNEIYTMNPDGTGKTRVTNNTALDSEPSWQPTSVKLLPAISINDITLKEPNSGNRNFIFTVTRSGNTTGVSSVKVKTANITAIAPSDYASNSATLNFAAGETTKTVTIVVKNDTSVEPDETFFVNLSNCIGCIITDTHGVGTILSGQAVSNGRIAFVSERDGNEEIYVMNADGSNVQRLTFDAVGNPKSDVSPTWSPDGTRIAFVSNRDGNYEIYAMNANGSNQQRLTSSIYGDINPTWSPKGTKIAFATNRDTNGLYYGYEIYVMNADGSNQQRLTNNSVDDVHPSWSPDGTRMAFATQRDGNYEIYVMNANGSNQQRMTFDTAVDGSPSWSHDGTRIVFVRNFGLYYAEIYIMNADACQECTGIPPTYLSGSVGAEVEPAFSPDGTKIAFATDKDGNYEIYAMNPDGSEQTRVTTNMAFDSQPSWQPISVTVTTSIIVTSPNSGETWIRGSTQTIKWTYTGNPGSRVKIELMKGGVLNRVINSSTPTGSSGSGSYKWLINSTQTAGTNYKVRITSASSTAYTDSSNNNFTISAPISCNTSTIYGYSFNDINSNKTKDKGEAGLSYRTINLKGYDTCTRTLVNKIIKTNATGYFAFKSINPGSYVLSQDYVLGWLPTTDASYNLNIPSVSVTIRRDFGNKKFI
jgi:Tol biopolymer transport system component